MWYDLRMFFVCSKCGITRLGHLMFGQKKNIHIVVSVITVLLKHTQVILMGNQNNNPIAVLASCTSRDSL